MIASLNIVANTFAKFAKTFDRLAATIIARRRRPVLILHLEAKYVKTDCKNEIYAKNWVRSTWITKNQHWQKVNGQLCQSQSQGQRLKESTTEVKVKLEMTLAMTQADDVIRGNMAE